MQRKWVRPEREGTTQKRATARFHLIGGQNRREKIKKEIDLLGQKKRDGGRETGGGGGDLAKSRYIGYKGGAENIRAQQEHPGGVTRDLRGPSECGKRDRL